MPAPFARPARAWVRPIPDRFFDALQLHAAPLDVERARRQHAEYVAALRGAGIEVVALPAAHDQPDSVFVEDPVVLVGPQVLQARSGAPTRAAEAAGLAAAIADQNGILTLADPTATLDGGDVLRLAGGFAVGLSRRTNASGAAALRGVAAPLGLSVVTLPVRAGLHLKSAVTLATPTLAVVDPNAVDPSAVSELGVDVLLVDEPLGANVLCLGDHTLVSAAAPRTAAALRARGIRVVVLELDALHQADGALTCCSVRQAPPGTWCT